PSWRVLFNIGVARKRLFRYNDAVRALRRYLDEGGPEVPADRRALVEAELADIRALVAEVSVLVDGPPAQIEVDGRAMGETPLPSPLLLAGGNHIVRAFREGFDPAQREIDVVSGQKVEVRLALAVALRERQRLEEQQRRQEEDARARRLADEAELAARIKPAQMGLCESDGGFAFCSAR